MDAQRSLKLPNGVEIPALGFGTWQIPNGAKAYDSVMTALRAGYRHVDTAKAYGNEASVGRAVRESGLERGEVFVTSKLPAEVKSHEGALRNWEATLASLDLEYVDLYLIHAPWPWTQIGADFSAENVRVWKAMEEIYASGRCRAVGVSNFSVEDLENVIEHGSLVPMVNQIKYHIGKTQPEVVARCREHGMLVEGYSPLATGDLLGNGEIAAVAKRYGKSVAQVAIRYCLQREVLPLPKSTTPARIESNLEVDFEITAEDMAYLDGLTKTA